MVLGAMKRVHNVAEELKKKHQLPYHTVERQRLVSKLAQVPFEQLNDSRWGFLWLDHQD
jgi:hypothetical protein